MSAIHPGMVYDDADIDLGCIRLETVMRVLRDRDEADTEPFWCEPEQWLSIVWQLRDLRRNPQTDNIAPHRVFIMGVEVSCRQWHPDLFTQDGERFIL